jgi:phosphopentomutase
LSPSAARAARANRPFDRFIVIVLDSVGCGDAPDAAAFGDDGANTLARVVNEAAPALPHLARLGLDRIAGVPPLARRQPAGARGVADEGTNGSGTGGASAPSRGDARDRRPLPAASWGRLTERSNAKDTMSGHWELMCVQSNQPLPLYPDGFPVEVIERFERAIGRGTLGNVPASGTEIIRELGEEHLRSGKPIVYTSGDSVFQIAAHEDVVPVDRLYRMCETARAQLDGDHRVARVIARPFVGNGAEDFERTSRRRDYALPPPEPTALDIMVETGLRTYGVGKIHDIFAGRGLSDWVKTESNADGVDKTIAAMRADAGDLIFTNLVDFDSKYGHRRDVRGYAAALEGFDHSVPCLLDALGSRDCLMITADHGNDPGFKGTDHTRERVPLLACSAHAPRDLGTRETFADLGRTVLDNFGLRGARGASFLDLLVG